MQQLNINQLKQALRVAMNLNIPTMTWGQPGTAKTEGHAQVVHDLDWLFLPFRLSLYDSVELHGIPSVSDRMSSWNPPTTLPFCGNPNFTTERMIYIFFDEMPQALPAVQNVAMQLVHEGRIGEHVLMPNVRVGAAGNRDGDKAATNRMPTPLANRFIHFELVPNLDAWCEWAWDQDYPAEVVAFLRLRPDLLSTFVDTKGVVTTEKAFATPRTWQFVCEIVQQRLPEELRYPLIAGAIGDGPAAELQGFLRICAQMPSIDGILLNPDTAVVPDDPATLFAVTAALAQRSEKGNFDAVVSYCNRIPPEFAMRTVKDAVRRKEELQLTKPFAQFASKYSEFMRG